MWKRVNTFVRYKLFTNKHILCTLFNVKLKCDYNHCPGFKTFNQKKKKKKSDQVNCTPDRAYSLLDSNRLIFS